MSKINLGQDLGIGQLPTDEEAALIRHNIKIDVDLEQDPTTGVGVVAPINTLGYFDNGDSPRVLQYFKKVGDSDLGWAKVIFKDEVETLLSTKATVIELNTNNPTSGVGVPALIGTYGYEEADLSTSTWWFKFGVGDTDWRRIALFSDISQFIEDFRTEIDAPGTVSGGALLIDVADGTVQNIILTEDTEISFSGFTTGATSAVLNIVSNGFVFSFNEDSPSQYVLWSESANIYHPRQRSRLFVESYDQGGSIQLTLIGGVL